MLKWVVFILAALILVESVAADCLYNGKSYPEGTVMGPYICRDKKWVKR